MKKKQPKKKVKQAAIKGRPNAVEAAILQADMDKIALVAQRNRIEEAVLFKIQQQFGRIPWDHYINTVLAPFIQKQAEEAVRRGFEVGGTAWRAVCEEAGKAAAAHLTASFSISVVPKHREEDHPV